MSYDTFRIILGALCVLWICSAMFLIIVGDELDDAYIPPSGGREDLLDDDVNNKHT